MIEQKTAFIHILGLNIGPIFFSVKLKKKRKKYPPCGFSGKRAELESEASEYFTLTVRAVPSVLSVWGLFPVFLNCSLSQNEFSHTSVSDISGAQRLQQVPGGRGGLNPVTMVVIFFAPEKKLVLLQVKHHCTRLASLASCRRLVRDHRKPLRHG